MATCSSSPGCCGLTGLFTADVDLQQQRLRSIHQKAMYAVGNFALAASLLIFAGNGVVLVWKFLRRRWDPVHTLLSSSLAAANFLVGVGLCFLFIVALGKDGGKHYSILCESSGVINMVATEAGVGFLFLIAVDRLIYTKNFDQVHGLSEKKTFVYCLLVWTFSLILGVVPSLPVPYFERELFNNNIICSHLHALYNRKSGWQYVACVHLVLNLVMFIVMLVLYIRAALYLRSRRSEPNQPLDREWSFYCKNAAIFTLSFITWIPGLAIGYAALHPFVSSLPVPLSGGALEWLAVVSQSLHAALNPIVYILFSCHCHHGDEEEEEQQDKVELTGEGFEERSADEEQGTHKVDQHIWTSELTSRQESIRLSAYMDRGEHLTARDAVIMTSSLSANVHMLHKNGMAASKVDPDHVWVEQDNLGNVVETHLTGVPLRPRTESMEKYVNGNKVAIGEIFERVMDYVKENAEDVERQKELNRSRFSSRRRGLSIKIPRSVSVRTMVRGRTLKRNRDPHRWTAKY